jgi:hypothetical protein
MEPFDEIDRLILNGGLQFAGKNSITGEPMYKPTEELKNINPSLSKDINDFFVASVSKLWEKGFLDMDVTIADPMVKLGPKALEINEIMGLPENERIVITQIIDTLYQKK